MSKDFDGKTILIVEDEFFVGSDLEQILADAGANAVLVNTASAALARLAETHVDAVILDIHLRSFHSSHGIITLNDRSLSPAARLFVETLRVVEAEATRDEPAVASLAEPPPKRRRIAR